MSVMVPGKMEIPDVGASKYSAKCRIPQRLSQLRPKSANRMKEELGMKWLTHPVARPARPDRERLLPVPKKTSTIPRRVSTDPLGSNKSNRPVITVPVMQRQAGKMTHYMKSCLPDQETIKRREDLELQQGDLSDTSATRTHLIETESITSRTDNLMQLKLTWQENADKFEKMRNDLKERQKALMELYAIMRSTHQKMAALGQKINLPSAEDLRIMNVARLTPEQLLQLCSRVPQEGIQRNETQAIGKIPVTIDMTKLYNMPSKLSATCEETIIKRKEIIDWFESIRTQEKGIKMNILSKKINEFNAENEALKCSLDQAKAEFIKELNEVVDYMRKSVNETVALQLRTEELTYEVSELNSQNSDLRKQIHNSDHLKTNKPRLEKLEKELKEERCKNIVIRDRLSRTEGQAKMGTERIAQLEAALEQARSQTRALERKVQQLHERNEKLQVDFDKELNKLTESIRENTMHLEEIADAREKLQLEKEDLEKRLEEMSMYYKESLENIKHEMNTNLEKIIETEKKYDQEREDKKKLELKVQSLYAQLSEVQLTHKETLKQLQEKQDHLNNNVKCQTELESTKQELHEAILKIEDYRTQLLKQSENINEIERNFKESLKLEENLKSNLATRDEYITEMEKKQTLLEQQLEESESQIEAYIKQLSSLKSHIAELQNDFGDFEDLNELHGMINQQRTQLLEVTKKNSELTEMLHKKDDQLERHLISLTKQEQVLEKRDDVIKMLSEKEEEHTNIIKLLRNNLEMRAQADSDLSKQLAEKNVQINSLITNVETRKQQISQLEKIILTLEDQKCKANLQNKKAQNKINLLEQKIADYETFQAENKTKLGSPTNNLDSIIKILEDELGSPYETQFNDTEQDIIASNQKYSADCERGSFENFDNFDFSKGNCNKNMRRSDNDAFPTKIVMGNFVKKTYISTNDEQHKGDNLDRKKAITNIDTQKWIPAPELNMPSLNMSQSPPVSNKTCPPFRGLFATGHNIKENLLARNIQSLAANQFRDERQNKMFKFAGHKL